MKNITFIIADLGMGGAQRVISLLADSLSDAQIYHIDVIVLSGRRETSFFAFPDHVSLHYADVLGSSRGVVSAVSANINRILTLRRMIGQLRSDLVVTFQTETNCTVLLAAACTGIPVIISERSDPYVYPESRVWRLIRRFVYPLASGAVFQTQYAARFFEGVVRHKTVIFNPVHIDDAGDAPAVNGPYILGVGRLSAEKGFDDLIRTHVLAREGIAGLKLVLVGSGPEKNKLEALVRDLGTEGDVVFAGAQSRLAGYYKNALAFILPSRFEGLPNALIEAMAYGCPVIATPLYRAAPEIIDHNVNGLIASEASPEGFSNQLIDLYKHSEKRQQLMLQGKADSGRFSAATIAKAWQGYIQEFLK